MFSRVLILLLLLVASPVWARPLAQGSGVEISVWRVAISLLFCLLLAAGAIFALRRRLPQRAFFKSTLATRLNLVEQISLGPQRGIYLIALDGREYLALFSQQGVSLTPLADAPDVAEGKE